MRRLVSFASLLFALFASNSWAATIADLGSASFDTESGVWNVVVGDLGNLSIDYADTNNGARSTFNGVDAAGIPTLHFGLDAGDAFTITADFLFSALQITVWDLDTVGSQETLTITGDTTIELFGADYNIPNGSSPTQGVLVATIMGQTITLEAGDGGAAFAIGGIAAVPVPAAAWLFGSALLGFSALKRRRIAR